MIFSLVSLCSPARSASVRPSHPRAALLLMTALATLLASAWTTTPAQAATGSDGGTFYVTLSADFGNVPIGMTSAAPFPVSPADPACDPTANPAFFGPPALALLKANGGAPVIVGPNAGDFVNGAGNAPSFRPTGLGRRCAFLLFLFMVPIGDQVFETNVVTEALTGTGTPPVTGNGASSEPNSSHLQIVGHGGEWTVRPGECVSLAFQVRFVGTQTYVDATHSPNTFYFTSPARGSFTGNQFCATGITQATDFPLYARYTDPATKISTVSTVILHVRP